MKTGAVSQARVDQLELNFVSEGLQPFAIVTLPAFRELIVGLQRGKMVMSRSTVRLRPSDDVGALRGRLIAATAAVACIATTTDCWSARVHRRDGALDCAGHIRACLGGVGVSHTPAT